MSDDPLSLEQELSEFMVKDGYGAAFPPKKFDDALTAIAGAVARICQRVDTAKRIDLLRANAAQRHKPVWTRSDLKAFIASHPRLSNFKIRDEFPAHNVLIADIRRELVEEGKLIRVGQRYMAPGDAK